ncbi:hypothetical protein [Nocardioides bizhenqiangii]|uniref:DUF222 domain-containing protein n=1 Tax=Nocardioides bizhenqiangii TaxID=3095076 RepID=A0ABZ0ZKQ6_9ACTN|nr:hypothetical protein [Nocardioides sp. HM61]WQQ24813.1 hypothetical protein SHK19_12635 [Nocardioides sp. HM61]
MKPSSIPDGIPVLSRGRHRTPRRGACFMELASVLAGERWSDHPSCTHPLLAYLARLVNDHTSDDGRQKLAPLIPSVVYRRGNDRTWLAVAVAVAAQVVLDVPEGTQRALAAGLLQAERLCADAGPDLAATRREAQLALGMVPGAAAWVDRLGVRSRIDANTFAKRCAPAMVRCAVDGVIASGSPDCDRRLGALLEAGIAACPAPDTEIAAPALTGARLPSLTG